MLNKEQQHQLRKFKMYYWEHCFADESSMERTGENLYVFRTPKKTRCVHLDAETKAEFNKYRYTIFMASIL
jgi:hypothetical protein